MPEPPVVSVLVLFPVPEILRSAGATVILFFSPFLLNFTIRLITPIAARPQNENNTRK